MEKRAPVGNCGLYCGSCAIYQSRENEDLRKRLARDMKCEPEEVGCRGCGQFSSSCHGNYCKIYFCASNRGFEFCHQCPEVPCGRLRRLSVGYGDLPLRQLEELKTLGAKDFNNLMDERWTCRCGGVISSYKNRCLSCGKSPICK